ncbi:MAG: prepilin-type N-terminal cleavage/methylation domain-containing protein [Candidatus Komeilibacteria bacterium]
MSSKRQSGFTLIELMILVVILFIVTALFILNFTTPTVRSVQSYAIGVLDQIYKMEQIYHADNGTYWGEGVSADSANTHNFCDIGILIESTSRYEYEIITANKTELVVRAIANLDDDSTEDIWMIDNASGGASGVPKCVTDDSAK